MIEPARAANVVLSTCYSRRFFPEVLAARDLILQGALGRVLGARIAEHIYREISYWFGGSSGRSRSDWRVRREASGGGVLLMNLCHHLDALFFVTGLKAGRVFCESDRFAAPGDVEDQVALTVRMREGAIASVDASTCAPGGARAPSRSGARTARSRSMIRHASCPCGGMRWGRPTSGATFPAGRSAGRGATSFAPLPLPSSAPPRIRFLPRNRWPCNFSSMPPIVRRNGRRP